MKYKRGLPSYQASIQSTQTAASRVAAASLASMRNSIGAPFQTVENLTMMHLENHGFTSNTYQLGLDSRPCSGTRIQQTSSAIIPITPQTLITTRYLMSLMGVFIRNSVENMSRQTGRHTIINTFKIHVMLHWGYLLMVSLSSARGTYLHGQSSLSTSTSPLMSTPTLPTSCVMVSLLHQQLSRIQTHSSTPSIVNLSNWRLGSQPLTLIKTNFSSSMFSWSRCLETCLQLPRSWGWKATMVFVLVSFVKYAVSVVLKERFTMCPYHIHREVTATMLWPFQNALTNTSLTKQEKWYLLTQMLKRTAYQQNTASRGFHSSLSLVHSHSPPHSPLISCTWSLKTSSLISSITALEISRTWTVDLNLMNLLQMSGLQSVKQGHIWKHHSIFIWSTNAKHQEGTIKHDSWFMLLLGSVHWPNSTLKPFSKWPVLQALHGSHLSHQILSQLWYGAHRYWKDKAWFCWVGHGIWAVSCFLQVTFFWLHSDYIGG